jgi:Holliday junction resolvase RusA-like endonuclease
VKYLCLILPFPPSTNGLFAGKTRRYISPRYRNWKRIAGLALNQQDNTHFGNPVKEIISLQRPVKKDGEMKKWDVANFEKALNDLLVEHHVLRDDSLIHDLHMRWVDDVIGARIEIEELA